MSSRVLIDTSTLLDAAMSERPDWQFAVMLLDEIAYGRLEGMVAATSLRDAYFVRNTLTRLRRAGSSRRSLRRSRSLPSMARCAARPHLATSPISKTG